MGNRDKPEMPYIREVLVEVQDYWSDQIDFDQEREDMYWEEDLVPQEDTAARNRRYRITPERMTANELRREVDLIVSLFPYPSEIGVQYVGSGSRSESSSERVELGLNEAIDQLNPPLDSPLLRGRWSMCLFGREARMIVPGHLYWWDAPKLEDFDSLDDWSEAYSKWHGQAPLPVTWVDLPANATFPPTLSLLDEEVVSWVATTGRELSSMFSASELGSLVTDRGDMSKEFTLVMYSNKAWLTYGVIPGSLVGTTPTGVEQIVRNVEHNLDVPAIQILPGVTSGKKVPVRYWQGVSDSSMKLIKAANRRLSEAATASKFDSLPIFKAWLQDENLLGEGAESRSQELPHGDLIPMRAGGDEGLEREDIQPLFMPEFGDKTLALAQFALTRAERNSGAVEALEGATGPSGEPAWSRNSIIEQSKMKQSRLAQAVAAADLNAAEMISRCLQAFGERVPITISGKNLKIVLKAEELKNYQVVLRSEYKMQLPISRRADIQLGVSVMEQAKRSGLPISPAWIMENIMDIPRPMEEFKRSLTWDLLMSEESKAYYRRLLVKEAEIDLSEQEGMTMEEFESGAAQQLPPDIAQQFRQLASGQGAPTGGNQGGVAQTSRSSRAGRPFSTSPTGPQPEEQAPVSGAGVY